MHEYERFEFIGDFSSLKKYNFKEKKNCYEYNWDDIAYIKIYKDRSYVSIISVFEYCGLPDEVIILLYHMIKEGLFAVVMVREFEYKYRYKRGKGKGQWWYSEYYCDSRDKFDKYLNNLSNSDYIYCVEEVK